MKTLLALVLLAVVVGCGGPQAPSTDLPVLESASADCTAEAYFRWGQVPFGVRVEPVCDYIPQEGDPAAPMRDANGCVIQACIDVSGFIRCDIVADTSRGR